MALMQVELAQVEYQLPRLTRMWSHLERQVGGSGSKGAVKGMGEKQIEVDKRILRKRISSIKRELEEVKIPQILFSTGSNFVASSSPDDTTSHL